MAVVPDAPRAGVCLHFRVERAARRCEVPVPLDHAARLRGRVGARAVAHGERGGHPEVERKSAGMRPTRTLSKVHPKSGLIEVRYRKLFRDDG
jgi:hypothetical protein